MLTVESTPRKHHLFTQETRHTTGNSEHGPSADEPSSISAVPNLPGNNTNPENELRSTPNLPRKRRRPPTNFNHRRRRTPLAKKNCVDLLPLSRTQKRNAELYDLSNELLSPPRICRECRETPSSVRSARAAKLPKIRRSPPLNADDELLY